MQTVSTEFERLLTGIMDKEIEAARDRICAGSLTAEKYQYECGKLAALQNVKGYFTEVNADLARD